MVADELAEILRNKLKFTKRPAIVVVRGMKSLHGIGVYTSLEIFAMAGEDAAFFKIARLKFLTLRL
jgi:hypothetical protein